MYYYKLHEMRITKLLFQQLNTVYEDANKTNQKCSNGNIILKCVKQHSKQVSSELIC